MTISVYIGSDKLDLFKDEGIQLTSSVASINDISRNFTDYTQNFTVPASSINNQIFKHYYDADIDNTFDARTKVDGYIELDGIPFKYGKWKLLKVNVKSNVASSYTINFTGNLFSLKEKFKEDRLSVLDLTAFDHTYNSTNVKTGLTTSLFSGDLIYTLLAKKQYYYKNLSSDNVNTDKLANIAWGGGSVTGVEWTDIKPSLKLIRIIEAIETYYNITFSRDFFGRVEFTDLFMWLNREADENGIRTEQLIDWDGGNGSDLGLSNTTDIWTNTGNTLQRFSYNISIFPTDPTTPYKVIVKNFGVPVAEFDVAGGDFTSGGIQVPITDFSGTPFEYTFYVSSTEQLTYTASINLRKLVYPLTIPPTIVNKTSTASTNSILTAFQVSSNIPNIKVIDFVKGLFQMFKLVAIADNNDNIYVNTLNDYYAAGQLFDLTRYTDFTSYDVERGNLLNTIKFNFDEPVSLLNKQFLANTGIAYGDEELVLEDSNGNILDGDTLEIDLPFEQVVYERLYDLNDNVQTNIMYGGIFDENIDPVNPTCHIFYNNNVNISAKPIAFKNESGTRSIVNTVNTSSHTSGFSTPQFSMVFGKEFNEWDGLIIDNTLYSNYYMNYVNSIFNIKRRNFRFNCKNIPLRVLTNLELNDIIQIKENFYRIDNYQFNLLTGEVDFNLINSFDNSIGAFNVDRQIINIDYTQQIQSVYVTNIGTFNYNSTELWVTATNTGGVVYLNIDENTSGLDRSATVTLINADTLQEVDVIIYQSPNTITFDTENITFDTDLIYWDNG